MFTLLVSEFPAFDVDLSHCFRDNQCANIGAVSGTLCEVKQSCLKTSGCTAFNFHPSGSVLRACSLPAPAPSWHLVIDGIPIAGYYIKK